MFDLAIEPVSRDTFRAQVPGLDEPWQIGAIVGPSGSGKTSIARAAFGNALYEAQLWPADRAVIDCLGDQPIKQITRTLTAVGFSSPRAWIKPHAVLSNGEKFRCELARALLCNAGVRGQGTGVSKDHAEATETSASSLTPDPWPLTPPPTPLIFDEYSSVVDRTVAKIGSAALSKAIRSGAIATRFVAVTCHDDIIRWLQPDWVLDMSGPLLHRGRVRASPITMRIERADRTLWSLFERHHYLSGTLHRAAMCFVARVEGRPAAFTAVLAFPHPIRPGWREHRTVCLPDFQGVGIGTALSDFIASLFVATGKPYFSTTIHPAMIAHRARSRLWKMHRKPRMVSSHGESSREKTAMSDTCSRGRCTAGFEYIGAARPKEARHLGVLPPRAQAIA